MQGAQDLENIQRQETRGYKGAGDLIAKLSAMGKRSGYKVMELNGQRVYVLSDKNIPPPPRGCEIFIKKLPNDMFEDVLVPLFQSVGPLYEFRLMLDFNYRSRRFAFAVYLTKEHADLAVRNLNGFRVRLGVQIVVLKSVDNRRLFVGNVPLHVKAQDLMQFFGKQVEGIVNVTTHRDYKEPHLKRGFAFVEFQDHRLAIKAIKKLTPNNLEAFGRELFVDWAFPVSDVDPQTMAKVCTLYMRNFPTEYTSQQVHAMLGNRVDVRLITKVHKIKNYAFVNFANRDSAELAFEKISGLTCTNWQGFEHTIQIEWARPRSFSAKLRFPGYEQDCMSVPWPMRRMLLEKSVPSAAPRISGIDLLHTFFINEGYGSSSSGIN